MDRKFQKVLDTVLDLIELYASRFESEGAVYCREDESGTLILVGKAQVRNGQIIPEKGIAIIIDMVIDCDKLIDKLADYGIVYRKIHIAAD